MSDPDHRHPDDSAPFNPVPPVVWALVAVIAVIELTFQAASRGIVGGADGVGWRLEALNAWAFSPQLWERMIEIGSYPVRDLARLVTYAFLHLNFPHVLFVLVFVLALGKMVAEVFRDWAFLAVFFASTIAGALAYAALLDTRVALFGGFPGAYGLIGAYTFILWVGLGHVGLAKVRAFTLIGVLMGIQLIFGLLFGVDDTWVADLAGFVTGFALSFVVSPGGWGRVMAKLRDR